MFKIKYTGAEKVSIVIVAFVILVFIYSFIKFHSFVSNTVSYLPIQTQTAAILSNLTVDLLLLYGLVLSFIKIRKYKKSEITVVEKYIEYTFDEMVSYVLYNIDKLYIRIRDYLKKD